MTEPKQSPQLSGALIAFGVAVTLILWAGAELAAIIASGHPLQSRRRWRFAARLRRSATPRRRRARGPDRSVGICPVRCSIGLRPDSS